MLNYRACLRHALDISTHRATLRHGQTRLLQTNAHSVVRKTDTGPTNLSEVDKLSRSNEEPWGKSAVAANQKKWERNALKRPLPHRRRGAERPDTQRQGAERNGTRRGVERPGTHEEESRPMGARKGIGQLDINKIGKRDSNMSERDWNNRKRELQYLKDPLELATFVKNELRKDRVTEMLQLTRMASHSMQCIVSWNHIIDYYLANEKVNNALKVYNEVRLPHRGR